ncbi:hypothetical protein [Flagellimonas eckloniae]|uniref:Adhesin domain-containing protein n=1 Tax=Flagellimonas eckloniae TaxID=346185 RepID=A0A0Q1BVJ5_9FLAO|nr:hypothetical protein [Allomuricauda eckloniae]KQC28521.1 hypothetical protein AAY42_00365 [Allomuricauda eckloniae]
MNRNHQILFNVFLFAIAGIACYGQEKSKTYKETFNVSKDAVLNIDTSHADIEFETWNKDQVEITAIVELEGATNEEAKSYFKEDMVKIVGNSKEIEVSTRGRSFSRAYNYNFDDLQFVIPDVSFVEPLFEDLRIPELSEIIVMPDLPPMPPVPHIQFDYDAYKKDGDEYMKKWKKDFDQNFDEEYQDRFEEWGEEVKRMAQERNKLLEERRAEREELLEERRVEREELLEERNKLREEALAKREKLIDQRDSLRKQRNEVRHLLRSDGMIRIQSDDDTNTFYFSFDGENKKYKVKKSIKIKMPKSVKLKMNVKHGEVKLAENTKNINASLSYASLHASTIDGDRTNIRASYSPVVVQKWNYGRLKTDYSESVSLEEVGELKLNGISSNIIIDRLVDKLYVTNNLGSLQINSVSDSFSNIDITVENGEVQCKIPSVPFSIYVNENTSDFICPTMISLESSKNYPITVRKGYHINKSTDKSININSKYSEVVLKQ